MQQDAEGPKPIPSPLPTTTATLPVEATPLEPVTGRTDEEVALSTKVPLYVLKQLRRRYAENGVTIRNQILLALRAVGLEIDDRDITDERKRARR
jgi:hypothetical protein